RRLDRFVEALSRLAVHVAWTSPRREPGRLHDLLADGRRDAAEIAGEESGHRVARRVVQHLEQHAELDAIGMRLDLARRRRQLLERPREFLGLTLRRHVRQLDVGIGDDRLLDVLVDRRTALLIPALHLQRHLRAARRLPGDLLLLEDAWLVLLGVDLHLEVVRGRACTGARDDLHRLAGSELTVHAGRRDADALLPAALPQPMELRAVQELGEDRRNLLPDDAGAVVGHGDAEPRRLARGRRRLALRDDVQTHDDIGQDPGFFAGVQRVVDGLLHAREQSLARIVEAEQVAILREELGDGDVALPR